MDPAAHPGLPDALRWLRHEARLTQAQAAQGAGLSVIYYKQLELGHRRPSAEALERVAAALGSSRGGLAALLARPPWGTTPPPRGGARPSRNSPRPAAYLEAARASMAARPGAAWSDPVAAAPPAPAPGVPPEEVAELIDLLTHLAPEDRRAVLEEARRRRRRRG